ncbi:MAG: hypothetical protein AB7U99_10825, partial [Steroidobacteraceae bacterium]
MRHHAPISVAIAAVLNTSIAAASATLSGRVLDQASGLPLPQAAVSVQLANADTIATADRKS